MIRDNEGLGKGYREGVLSEQNRDLYT